MSRRKSWLLFVTATWCLIPAMSARAYVDLAPTLGRIVREAQTISIVEVDRFNRDKGAVILKKVRDLRGVTGGDPIKHQLIRSNESTVDRHILEWAEPGRRGVLFVSGKTALLCTGHGWYQVQSAAEGWWAIGPTRPDLPLAYYGTVSRLGEAVTAMLAEKSAIITTMPHGADQEGASFDLALNRASLPGLVKMQRVRASLAMPPVAAAALSNPAFIAGFGQADEGEIPALRKNLFAADATTRAESAADLGSLGSKAAAATGDLTKLLDDESPMARMAAAAALLRVSPKEPRPMQLLADGLTSKDAVVRRHAARSAGLAGPAAAPLTGKLAALLNDSDNLIRRIALQAIATLGPSAAAALDQVIPLVDNPDTAIDAADTLGRMGPAARPALKTLAKLLTADAVPVRWAGVRAMSQIGGDAAAPAVKFMIRELRNSTEVDSYNMMIYLSLLGPVAKEAIPAIQNSRLRNPVLRQTTIWAIEPGTNMPWLGPLGEAEPVTWIMESYVRELGGHLKPAALSLAKKIMNGAAGNVPSWGYKLLARFPEESLAILSPGLGDKEITQRQRAAVAIGYMGQVAASAKPQVAKALAATQDEKEQRLLKWCLREID